MPDDTRWLLRSLAGLVPGRTLAVLVLGVGLTLAVGTDTLVAAGLPRRVAGGLVTVVVVAGCLWGLTRVGRRVLGR